MKSELRTLLTVGITDATTSLCDVDRAFWMTALTIYITSSTADVMNGGLPSMALLKLNDSPDGDSSSWKAFSTDRLKKNVDMTL